MSTLEYSSLSALAAHVATLPRQSAEDVRFQGGTIATATDLAAHGWPEGTRRATALVDRIADRAVQSQSASTTEPMIGYDVTGAAYDAGAYLSGAPECWSTLQPTESKRGIRIVVNLSVSGGVPNSAIEARGTAIAALVLALQSRGRPVTLDVADLSTEKCSSRIADALFVRVIDGAVGSPLDIDRVVYALAHPTMFRGLIASASDGFVGSHAGTAWGKKRPYRETEPSTEDANGAYDLYIGGAHVKDAERWQDGGEAWVLAEFDRQTTTNEE